MFCEDRPMLRMRRGSGDHCSVPEYQRIFLSVDTTNIVEPETVIPLYWIYANVSQLEGCITSTP